MAVICLVKQHLPLITAVKTVLTMLLLSKHKWKKWKLYKSHHNKECWTDFCWLLIGCVYSSCLSTGSWMSEEKYCSLQTLDSSKYPTQISPSQQTDSHCQDNPSFRIIQSLQALLFPMVTVDVCSAFQDSLQHLCPAKPTVRLHQLHAWLDNYTGLAQDN